MSDSDHNNNNDSPDVSDGTDNTPNMYDGTFELPKPKILILSPIVGLIIASINKFLLPQGDIYLVLFFCLAAGIVLNANLVFNTRRMYKDGFDKVIVTSVIVFFSELLCYGLISRVG